MLDFGVVRSTKGEDPLVTAPGQVIGTPASMAPELVAGTQGGPAADLYGLGCVAYWLLTGRQVFEGPNLMALLMQHASATPVPPSAHRSSIPKALDEIVLHCLEKKPQNRVN